MHERRLHSVTPLAAFNDRPAIVAAARHDIDLVVAALAVLGDEQLAGLAPRQPLRIAVAVGVDERARERIVGRDLAVRCHPAELFPRGCQDPAAGRDSRSIRSSHTDDRRDRSRAVRRCKADGREFRRNSTRVSRHVVAVESGLDHLVLQRAGGPVRMIEESTAATWRSPAPRRCREGRRRPRGPRVGRLDFVAA